ncbi:HNH endonuclease signature motif containing protein [Sinomonas susongensis]|uniref:HNH endonuclease signature motif containing protein n=1 Tax=Sinomonas susongensis TaxID=1324851 RepID=UPI0014862D93|nr:HNH endonuclease signature motif containing protein [Sinomonas susongensis]
MIGWATAAKLEALARLEHALAREALPRREGQPRRFGGDEAHALAVAEAAAATAVSEAAAARALNEAAELAGHGREVLAALRAGAISHQHARVILDQCRTLPPGHAASFARQGLERAVTRTGRRRTPAELRSSLHRLRERSHPESIQARKQAAARDRGVWFAPEPDGMCTLTALLPAEAGLAIRNGLDHDARTARTPAPHPQDGKPAQHPRPQHTGDGHTGDEHTGDEATGAQQAGPEAVGVAAQERTLSQLRADALVHRLLGSPDPAFPGPFRPEVTITIPVRTLVPDPEHTPEDTAPGATTPTPPAAHRPRPATGPATGGPAIGAVPGRAGPGGPELEGFGPIDPATARRLAALAPNWDRLFTDWDTGAALGVGRTAYRPPRALRRYLAHRDGGCLFPGCTAPARTCEPDHTTEWQDGGTTDPHNLALLCRKHHALKSIGAWTYQHRTHRPRQPDTEQPKDARSHTVMEWKSALGRTYISETARPEIVPEILPPETALPESALPESAPP